MRSKPGLVIKRNRLLVFLEVSVSVKNIGDQKFNLTFKKHSRCDIKMKATQHKVSAYQNLVEGYMCATCFFKGTSNLFL